LRAQGARWSASGGVFGNDIKDEDTRKIPGRSAIARLVFAPVNEDRNTLHIGASFEYRDADAGASVRFRARPETAATDVRLIDTGTIAGVAHLMTVEADFAWAPGPFTLQFEGLRSTVARDLSGSLSFQGVSVATSFVFTGERRSYRVGTGSFGSIKPKHKWGAIELAGRYSHLDLEDGTITGGTENNGTVALNWYWTRGSRLALDYIKVDAKPNRNGVNESPSALLLRLQLGF
jgi:phosphate-selective porin OprO/OprP